MKLALSEFGYERLKSMIDEIEVVTASALNGVTKQDDAIKEIRAKTFRLRDVLNIEVEIEPDGPKIA